MQWRQLRLQPRRVRESRLLWLGCGLRLSGLRCGSGCRRQLRCRPLRVRESRLSWRLDGRCPLSGERCESGSSGACSGVVTNCENQTIAPVVAWLRAAVSSEDAGWRRSTGLIFCAATPRAKSAIATSVCAPRLSREERYGNRVSAGKWTPPPSGGEAPAPCR